MDQKNIRFMKGLSTGLVVAAIVFAFLIAGIRIFGVQVFGVLTGSMEPAYPTGSLIYVKDTDTKDLRVNDVITFSLSPGVIATHRIVEIVPDEKNFSNLLYRTKGDANRDVDASLVSANNIIGKVLFCVPQMGYLASYIQQPPGLYMAILVCGLMIAFVFYTDSLEEKQKKQAQYPAAGGSAGSGFADAVNKISQMLLKRDIIRKDTADFPLQRGYVPQNTYPQQYPVQNGAMQGQPYVQGYPQQGYQQNSQFGQQVQYPQQYQQGYPQQPYYPQQMQQTGQIQQPQQMYYPQQGYGQQMYQQPVQAMPQKTYQPPAPQNPFAAPGQQDNVMPQQRNRRADRMQ